MLDVSIAYHKTLTRNSSAVVSDLTQPIHAAVAQLGHLPKLQRLFLVGNRIESLKEISSLHALSVLDLKCNYVSKLTEVKLLAHNARLHTLTLSGNQVARISTYRKVCSKVLILRR